VLGSQEVHDIAVAIGVDPRRRTTSPACATARSASSPTPTPTALHIATLLCALFLRHFPALVAAGHVYVAMPPLYRIDVGKEVFYALDEDEKRGILDRIAAENQGQGQRAALQGPGRDEPAPAARDHHGPDTRRLVQLTIDDPDDPALMDMLLAKKRAGDRKRLAGGQGGIWRNRYIGEA
jgi:topoisomerase-4 subunit B